jgi:nucleotide-binding universal stress UspA family protein
MERLLKDAYDYAGYELNQIVGPLQHQGYACEALLAEGDPGETITAFARTRAADLIVVSSSSRAGLDKLLLGSVAEEIICEAPCPVLTVGPRVNSFTPEIFQSIVCATDFSQASMRATEFALSLAQEYEARMALLHVIDHTLSPCFSTQLAEKRLSELLASEQELRHEPQIVVEIGPVAEHILHVANVQSADLIAIGARGAGAFAQTGSHFGSIAHKVVSLAKCPVLTAGGRHEVPYVNGKELASWNQQQSW